MTKGGAIVIQEILPEGKENAMKGRDIMALLDINERELMAAIEAERRAGAPICASTDNKNGGYYIAANKKEMIDYCSSLLRRGGNLFKTRRACLATVDSLPESEG